MKSRDPYADMEALTSLDRALEAVDAAIAAADAARGVASLPSADAARLRRATESLQKSKLELDGAVADLRARTDRYANRAGAKAPPAPGPRRRRRRSPIRI